MEWWKIIWLFVAAFWLSAVSGGIGYLKRHRKRTWIDGIVASGFAGCTGLGISLLWSSRFSDPTVLLGLCVFSGLLGATGIEQVITLVRRLTELYDQRKGGE